MSPRWFRTTLAGLFLFVPLREGIDLGRVVEAGGLPGSQTIPAEPAVRSLLALKLLGAERKSRVMDFPIHRAVVALFAGLNVVPQRSCLAAYGSRVDRRAKVRLMDAWLEQLEGAGLPPGGSLDPDFHTVPAHTATEPLEKHYVSSRSRGEGRKAIHGGPMLYPSSQSPEAPSARAVGLPAIAADSKHPRPDPPARTAEESLPRRHRRSGCRSPGRPQQRRSRAAYGVESDSGTGRTRLLRGPDLMNVDITPDISSFGPLVPSHGAAVRHAYRNFGVPAPRPLARPFATAIVVTRSVHHFVVRVLFCEPFFKAHCSRYGRNAHTGPSSHFIFVGGELIVGDNVLIEGKCGIGFASQYSDRPTLIIGDNTGIGHRCRFGIGKCITIGRDCRIAGGVLIFDSAGHPADPDARRAGLPATSDEARPVPIEDNVWIGAQAIIMPGVTIGAGSVVAAGAVVMTNVPPNTMVAGNPARQVRALVKTA